MVRVAAMVYRFAGTMAGCLALGGCLLTGISGGTTGGTTSGIVSFTLERQSACTYDPATKTNVCTVSVSVQPPPPTPPISFSGTITLKGIPSALTLYDPLILQVPQTASNFSALLNLGPPGFPVVDALTVTSGLQSIPADATTNIVAEPGMQLVLIDWTWPAEITIGAYGLQFSYTGTAQPIKALFSLAVPANTLNKAAQTYYPPVFPCVTDFAAIPAIALPVTSMASLLPVANPANACNGKVYDFSVSAAPSVEVVEYYNASLDHYFITWLPTEVAVLDAGVTIKGWVRTGKTLRTYTTAQQGTSPICRYYIPPLLGDSHFFGRGTVECNATGANNPSFVLEDPAFMQMYLPAAGTCASGTTPVYRVFSNRRDANHRYMTDRAVRDAMVAAGWLAEGDGPDLVVMCAPA
jgi:hypothetical protein